jgi:hypothetical protein
VSIAGGQWCGREPKVVKLGGFVVGAAGDCAWVDAVLGIKFPVRASELWMVSEFPKLFKSSTRDLPDKLNGQALIGARGNLWTVDENGSPSEPLESYSAIGSAWLVAIGALFSERFWNEPRRRVELALAAANHHHTKVLPPFRVVSA